MKCVFCGQQFEDPAEYRQHMKTEHKKFNVVRSLSHVKGTDLYPKVDCSELACRVCKKDFDDIKKIAVHLREEHNVKIVGDNLGLLVFKFGTNGWTCAECQENCLSLRVLSRHTATHYRSDICSECGKSYSSKRDLDRHILLIHAKLIQCTKCRIEFKTNQDLAKHRMESKMCWRYKCNVCNERFPGMVGKAKHIAEQHRETMNVIKCSSCPETFPDRSRYRKHFIIAHTTKFACSFCDQRFMNSQPLKDHIAAFHTGAKDYVCDVCEKSFARKKSLAQHYWQHREDKRFKCDICCVQFNQKVSWKSHMRSRHPELVDF